MEQPWARPSMFLLHKIACGQDVILVPVMLNILAANLALETNQQISYPNDEIRTTDTFRARGVQNNTTPPRIFRSSFGKQVITYFFQTLHKCEKSILLFLYTFRFTLIPEREKI